jgi:hypothetical protein
MKTFKQLIQHADSTPNADAEEAALHARPEMTDMGRSLGVIEDNEEYCLPEDPEEWDGLDMEIWALNC